MKLSCELYVNNLLIYYIGKQSTRKLQEIKLKSVNSDQQADHKTQIFEQQINRNTSKEGE